MKEIKTPGHGEYVEKKSRFIATLSAVYSEAEAADVIESTKKKHYDARHVCSAYCVMNDDGSTISRFSDDGEPSGTAGKPILDALEGAGIVNGIITVTRYFGGTLLGTGGLVRSYSTAAAEAVSNAVLAERINVFPLDVEVDYAISEKVKYIFRQEDIPAPDPEYGAKVTLKAMVPIEKKESLAKTILEISAGDAVLTWGDQTGFLL